MGVGKGAPEKVTLELKTDTCTVGYQPATGSLCSGCMCVGKGTPERGYPNRENTYAKISRMIVKGHTE